MVVSRDELCGIRIAGLHYFQHTVDARCIAVRVIKKCLVADPHLVAQHVPRLVVAHAIPHRGALRGLHEVRESEYRGFRFHQPVVHEVLPESA